MPTIGELVPFKIGVIDRVRALAADYPDRVATCTYLTTGGAPICIFGHVLAERGARVAGEGEAQKYVLREGDLVSKDGTRICAPNNRVSAVDWFYLGIIDEPSTTQLAWAAWVQSEQDNGVPWASAVATADANVGVL